MSNYRSSLLARWRLVAGIILIGVAMAWQPLISKSSDDGLDSFSVRPDTSDFDLFGKKLVTYRVNPASDQYQSNLTAGQGPIIPVRLRIPALNIDARVESVNVRNGRMDVPTNIWNAAWLQTSVRPGEKGSAVIDAHKDSVNGLALFYNLQDLHVGDRIYVSDRGGYELTFEVYQTASYDVNNAPMERIFAGSSDAYLNLLTCDGIFNTEQHNYDKRLVIYTRQIK